MDFHLCHICSRFIAEQLPLKQGLKPQNCTDWGRHDFIAEQLPLKQGLKPVSIFINNRSGRIIAEQLPLKQGLKRSPASSIRTSWLSLQNSFH